MSVIFIYAGITFLLFVVAVATTAYALGKTVELGIEYDSLPLESEENNG